MVLKNKKISFPKLFQTGQIKFLTCFQWDYTNKIFNPLSANDRYTLPWSLRTAVTPDDTVKIMKEF